MGLPVLNYPNYTVDEEGRIYSIKSNKFIKPSTSKKGYMSVELFNENGSKRMLVHRIVAMAYIPNPNDYPQVNHIDENPSNNNVERYLGLKNSHISECCMGKRKTSNGFHWKYERGSDLSDCQC